MQVKATDRLRIRAGQVTIPCRIDRRDLALWLAEPMPVVMIVYDVAKDNCYWLYVQGHFSRRKGFNLFAAGKSVTARIPVANVLDASAMRLFAIFRDRVLDQLEDVTHDED